MTVEAYAKVNLTLEVYGRRSDGYHALRSVVLPVSFFDTLTVEDALALSSDSGYPDDLCLKAARVLEPTRGASIHVEKHIPAGGGLGGGSADAAATLVALNDLWGLMKPREELAEIGAQVGSDVPSLVLGGPVLMEGRGEKVTRLAGLTDGAHLHVVLVHPGVASSTAEVYARYEAPAVSGRRSATDAMAAALAANDFDGIVAALANDLTAPATELHPEIATALERLKAAGAAGVSMSGSGSTVFGLVRTASEADALAAKMQEAGYAAWAVRSVQNS